MIGAASATIDSVPEDEAAKGPGDPTGGTTALSPRDPLAPAPTRVPTDLATPLLSIPPPLAAPADISIAFTDRDCIIPNPV